MMSMSQDFEQYARDRAQKGVVPTAWEAAFRENVLPLLSSDQERRCLDYGFGNGKYVPFFTAWFKKENIYGVEVSDTRVQRLQREGWKNMLLVKPLEPLPFDRDTFHLIHSDQVIEHIPISDIDFYMQEIHRILYPDGVCFFVTPNYPVKRVYDIIDVFFGRFQRLHDDPTHVNKFTVSKAKKLFKKYFFDVEIIPTGGIFFRLLRHSFFSRKIIVIAHNKK